MIFSSLLFLFRFLPVMILVYFAVGKRFRNGVLFLGSLFFYGWGEPVYMSLLLFSTAVDYIHGRMIDRFLWVGKRKQARWCVISSALINLGLLGFFKYSGFFADTVQLLTGISIPLKQVALPIGISFYTFQTMSYTIDVYRGKAPVQKDMVAFGAYVAMFPQLIAGPIVRYNTIADELNQRQESMEEAAFGVQIFLIGLAKKVLLANQMGALFEQIRGVLPAEQTVLMLWLGIMAYGFQIYFDFSGYSDMAVGLGRLLGFHFPENFRYPYLAVSITDFWRRWHISLSTWFKEYVYIPLGGNRKGGAKQVRNILIVWLLTGIWHGAGWNFLLWGMYFGILLLMEKWFFHKWLTGIPKILQHVYALLLVLFGWVLFAHENLSDGILFLKGMLGMRGLEFSDGRTVYLFVTSLFLLAAGCLGSTDYPSRWYGWIKAKFSVNTRSAFDFILMAAALLLCVACLVNAGYNPFLYFRF